MPFPSLKPTSRSYDGGDYPVRTFKSQSGAESRILYGSQRTGMSLSLAFNNLTDQQAQQFIDHYDETKGTYLTFDLPADVLTGWSGDRATIDATGGNAWRYAEPPAIGNVKPGRSSVQVKLVGVL